MLSSACQPARVSAIGSMAPCTTAAIGTIFGSLASPNTWNRMVGRAERSRAITPSGSTWLGSALGALSQAAAPASVASMSPVASAGSDGRMRESYGGRHRGASAEQAARLLAGLAGTSGHVGPLPTLESLDAADRQPPRVEEVVPIEGSVVRALPVPGTPEVGFAAFLDGIQRSVVVPGGRPTVPIVHGTVAAAVRRRRDDRGLETWGGGAVMRRAIFVPVARVDADVREALERAGFELADTGADGTHPLEILGAAREAVQRAREQVEAALAARWCDAETAPLYVDGGVAGLGEPASRDAVIGVVKSHRTAYGGTAAVDIVTRLPVGFRTTAFAV